MKDVLPTDITAMRKIDSEIAHAAVLGKKSEYTHFLGDGVSFFLQSPTQLQPALI